MVLVESSVWISNVSGKNESIPLNNLIEDNKICINELILAELVPSINLKKENELKELLYTITRINLDINWDKIINMQTINIKNGINKVGIADLIIAQNTIENDLQLFTFDKHFSLMAKFHNIKMYL